MKPAFVAGFGPIVADPAAGRAFWDGALGIALHEIAPDYYGTDDLEGVRAFALWPLAEAAEACFGAPAWPPDLPVPQAWIEFDLDLPEAVGAAVAELRAAGQRLITEAHVEPVGPDYGAAPQPGRTAGGDHLHALDARGRRGVDLRASVRAGDATHR